MTGSIELIVLGTTKVGDKALVVHTLSREMGRRGFIVRPGKKASASLFLPLNILEADVVENPKSELWSLKNLSARDSLEGIRGNIHKNTMTLFLSEVLFRTLREGVFEDGLYEWCVGSILTLNALGFRPSWEDVAPFAEENAAALREFLKADFGESMLLPLSGSARNAMAESLVRYLEYHTEQPIRVKSLAVLRELYR